ncbi:transposase [Streptomyces sp. NBC_00091]|uniref:RNA-guided endonuclease InsQ/TnpB family protein n=1 Tax=Streptomyces sp. NBC_00091 TaxID=2975648 RepID=UPI002254CC26|nr:transposase [Streptomyces sp. NBC_00091]MCX5378122.1 transposase [Streptomyces sp. NBC_00091]
MKADMGRRYRAYPTDGQGQVLTRWGHTVRALWNVALEQRMYLWEQRRYTLRSAEQCKQLTAGRADLEWLGELPAQAGQQILRQLDQAHDNFWNLQAGFPRRKKRGHRLSIPFPGQAIEIRKLNRKWAEVRLPKLGWLRFRLSRAIGGTVRNATVSRDGNGWHISFGIHTGRQPGAPNKKLACGVDFGVAVSAFVSTETTPRLMPPTLTANEKNRLKALEQRRARQLTYAKKHNGGRYSRRLRQTITQIAKLTARRTNRRRDFTHKLTTDLAKNHGMIGIEDLRVKNMTKTAKGSVETPGKKVRAKACLNRAILDGTPGERRRQLEYKTRIYGSVLVAVPPFHTSQTCAACGLVDPQSRQGCGRLFACTRCGHEDDADHNASVEIEARARRTSGSDINSTHSAPRVRVRASRPRRTREAQRPAHAG